MNSLFKQEHLFSMNMFASPPHVEEYHDYISSLPRFDPSLLDLSSTTMDEKMITDLYPSPSESPVSSDTLIVTPTDTNHFYLAATANNNDILNTMSMVPPLGHYHQGLEAINDQFDFCCLDQQQQLEDDDMSEIKFVDDFIAQHEAALSFSEVKQQQQQQPEKKKKKKEQQMAFKEITWSHWSLPGESSPKPSSKSDDSLSTLVEKDQNSASKKRSYTSRKESNSNKKKFMSVKSSNNSTTLKKNNLKAPKPAVDGALYVCQHHECGRTFTRPYNLTSHMRTHTTDRPYACSHCGRRFARQHDRNRHEKLHWGIRPYACHFCHKSFARMDALNRHLRMENGCAGSNA